MLAALGYLPALLFGLHRQTVPKRQRDHKIAMRTQIGEGIRQVAASRQLRSIAIAASIINLFGRLMIVLVPLYLVREAGYRPAAIGVVFACGSTGFLLGAAVADKVAARIGWRPSGD